MGFRQKKLVDREPECFHIDHQSGQEHVDKLSLYLTELEKTLSAYRNLAKSSSTLIPATGRN
jgi:hypothetical protein